jgi:hypothetical protein
MFRIVRNLYALAVLVWLAAVPAALAADLPAGQIIDRVACAADASQSYALYVPARYTPSRVWPVIFAFDPGGRGRTPVERYQIAAERYGFMVVGSNNSRNGRFARRGTICRPRQSSQPTRWSDSLRAGCSPR